MSALITAISAVIAVAMLILAVTTLWNRRGVPSEVDEDAVTNPIEVKR